MDAEVIHDPFASIGPIRVHRLFGESAIDADGRIVALRLRDHLHLDGDETAGALYEAAVHRGGATPALPVC